MTIARAARSGLATWGAVPAFFGLRIVSALLLLKVSAITLPPAGFAVLTQYLLFAALLAMIAAGGAQNGIVREAAAGDDAGAARARLGGFVLWGAAAVAIGLPTLLLARPVAVLLVGDASTAATAVAITLLVFLAAPGQIWCALLAGRGRIGTSFAAQGAGLIAGTAAALALLLRHDPTGAAVAFAAGPLLTAAIAWIAVRRLALPVADRSAKWIEARRLLGFSGAFLGLALFSTLTLFALRYAYREAFGVAALAFWLIANRVSDVNTQALGLCMTQLFVPRYAAASEPARRSLLPRAWALAATVMALPALLVLALPMLPLARLILSDAYVAALPGIGLYLLGDLLRVWASLAMHAAFARRHLWRYARIEVATVTLFALLTLAAIARGYGNGPLIAYPIAYGVTAIVVTLCWLLARRRDARSC